MLHGGKYREKDKVQHALDTTDTSRYNARLIYQRLKYAQQDHSYPSLQKILG